MDRRSTIESRMRSLEKELAELEKFGEDVYSDGDVLIFTVRFGTSPDRYTYAALKTGEVWHLTGRRNSSYMSWDELVAFWRDSNIVSLCKVVRTKIIGLGS